MIGFSGRKLFRIMKTDVEAHWSILILIGLIFFSLFSGLSGRGVISGAFVALSVSLLSIVFLIGHEMAHTWVANKFGHRVPRIVMFGLGGVALMESEPQSGWQEFAIGIVGPLSSFIFGIVCVLLGVFISTAPSANHIYTQENIFALTFIITGAFNFMIAIFNMLPAYPMDGGRVVRGVIWHLSRKKFWSGKIASAISMGTSGLLCLAGLLMLFGVHIPLLGSGTGGLWLGFIGFIIFIQARELYKRYS